MKRRVIRIVITLLCVLIIGTSVSAETFSGIRYFEGVEYTPQGDNYTLYFNYSDSSVSAQGYSFVCSSAAQYWNHNLSKITTVSGSQYANSARDYIICITGYDPAILAYTKKLNYLGYTIDDPNDDWYRTKIEIYYNYMNTKISNLGMTSDEAEAFKRYIVAHEMGHSLKLAHSSMAVCYTVMRNGWYDYPLYYMYTSESSYSIRQYDNSDLNAKWGVH